MASSSLPASHADLLERPLFAHLATVRPDGSPQSSVMWFEWDGTHLRFTHTSARQKFQNLEREPRVAISILDPDDPYRFLEVRGQVASIVPDPDAAFYLSLQQRYGESFPTDDAAVRVVISIEATSFIAVTRGRVVPSD
jgi:PPOX class probable F420-dependent enzyme